MHKSKFNEEQISEILNQENTGTSIDTICNTFNISPGTYYKWRSKYKGFNVTELKRINELEHKNRVLKRLYKQSVYQREILQRAIEGKF